MNWPKKDSSSSNKIKEDILAYYFKYKEQKADKFSGKSLLEQGLMNFSTNIF